MFQFREALKGRSISGMATIVGSKPSKTVSDIGPLKVADYGMCVFFSTWESICLGGSLKQLEDDQFRT